MKKVVSLITLIITIFVLSITAFASSSVAKPSSGGASSGGGSSSGGSGGGSSKPITSVFPYTKRTFQGTVYLPEGQVAPEGGLAFTINFPVVSSANISYGAGTVGVSEPVTVLSIPSGENKVSYSINKYIRNDTESIVVQVLLQDNPDEKFLYGNTSSVINIDSSDVFVADVHIAYPDSKLKGCFTLGENAELLSEKASVNISLTDTNDIEVYNKTYTLPINTRSIDFDIPAKQGEKYTLKYRVNATAMSQQHISPKTIEYSETILVDDEEITGIVLEAAYREVVSGTISLPTGMKAPEGGLRIQISGASTIQVVIPESENSVNYIVAKQGNTYFTPIQDNYEEIKFKEYVLDGRSTESNIQLKPIYSVYGILSISEIAIDDIQLSVYASLNEMPDMDRWDSAISVTIPEGSSSVPFCIEIDDACPIDEVYLAVYDDTFSDKYIHFEGAFSKAIQLPQYNNEYLFETLDIEKAVEVIKGTIQIPQDFVSKESRIRIEAYSKNHDLSTTVWTDGKSNTVDFTLYGETSDYDMYNGEYVFYITYDDYTWFEIYHNNGSFSIQNKSGITVNNEPCVLNIVLPEPNLSLSGTIILPNSLNEEIEVCISLYDQYGFSQGDRIITIPANTTSYNFSTSFLARTDIGNYKISYSINDAKTSPYAEGRIVYITDDGYTEDIDDADEFVADNVYSDVSIDVSPFECSAIIQGSVTIPFGIVPSDNTYFDVEVIATNGNYKETDIVVFKAGEDTKEYSIAIPEMYADGVWNIYYIIGSASSIPSAPKIKTEVIRDSDFSIPESVPGGGGIDGVGSTYPKYKIPSGIIRGTNVYYSSSGMVFSDKTAKDFVFDGTSYENVDLTLVTMDMEYPRNIGGYFLSVKDDVKFTVELIDYETGEIVAEKNYATTGEATWYEFSVIGAKTYIIKFSYEDKEYYYRPEKLTTDKEIAFKIEASSDPNQYKYNVYYENINQHYQTVQTRYLTFDLEYSKYPNVNICLFDVDGNIIDCSPEGTLLTEEKRVYIGMEYCGQIRYLKNIIKKSARNTCLVDTTEEITEAKMYILPHISEKNIVVTIDISDFISGISTGFDGAVLVEEAYINYENTSDDRYVDSLYIDLADGVLDGSNTLYIAFYGEHGQLTDLKSITELPIDKTVPLGFTLDADGYIKVMCFQPQLQPMFDVVQFFE